MSGFYVLAPEAARDLAEIWRYIKKKSSIEMAERVESVIRDKILFFGGESRRWSFAQGFDGRAPQIFAGLFLPDRLPSR